MPDDTAKKVVMITPKELSKIQSIIPFDQLQEKYSGMLPNLKEFW